MIKYIKGDLFELAPSNSMIIHAVNCQGVWGSGVAKTIKDKFFQEFLVYHSYCYTKQTDFTTKASGALGESLIANRVVCLFTSLDYGIKVDNPEKIIENTKKAIDDLLTKTPCTEFHLPKINSGLFKVPWEQTEAILKEYPHIIWNVYEL